MKKKEKRGFTLVEIMIVVAIIGLLAAIAVPNFVSARNTAAQNACDEMLNKIDGAVVNYQADNGSWPTAVGDIGTYFLGGAVGGCPGGTGTYSFTATTPPRGDCSVH